MKYINWLDEWLTIYVRPTCKYRTVQKYVTQVKKHISPILGEYELNNLTAVVLQKFTVELSNKGLSANTVNSVISVVKSSLKRAVSLNVADKEYTSVIVRPKAHEKGVESFSVSEQQKIESYIAQKDNPKLFGIVLCLYTGLRIGELLALKWEDIDFNKGVMRITKSCRDGWKDGKYEKISDEPKTDNAKRYIPIPKALLTKLKILHKQSGCTYVVCSRNGEYGAQVRSYQKTFERILQKLNIPHKGFHALRHTFATRAIECGMDVRTLAEVMGHSNPTVTLKRYAHSMLEHKTAMMNRLNKFIL